MLDLRTLCALTATLSIGACMVGPESQPESQDGDVAYLDTDGDGQYDAIDVDFDGIADYVLDCTGDACEGVAQVASCLTPLLDTDHDGVYDAIDWNCDGQIDGWLTPSTPSSTCKSSVSSNGTKKTVDCKQTNGTWSCSCLLDDKQVKTCSTTSSSACSIPGNCCGF